MKKAFKTAALYVGTAIGAGFSSGREIALFFGKSSPLNVAISSIFMSLICALFLIAGKKRLIPKGKIVNLGIFFAASVSLCAMLAGGDFVMQSMTGIPLAFGLAMTVLGGIIVVLGIEKIRVLNTIVVPLIVLCISIVFFKLPTPQSSLPFTLSKPILYSGLDVLLGGVIVSEEGENLSYKEIFASCLMICVFLFGMLFMLQTVVLSDTNGSLMPTLAVSEILHLKFACGVLIAGAIFTTLVSSLKIVSDRTSSFLSRTKKLSVLGDEKHKAFVVFFCLLVAYPLSFFGFDNRVDTLYPVNSVLGVILFAIVVLRLVFDAVKTLKSKKKSTPEGVQKVMTNQINRGDDDRSHNHRRNRDDGNRNPRLHNHDDGNRNRHRHSQSRRHNRNLRPRSRSPRRSLRRNVRDFA